MRDTEKPCRAHVPAQAQEAQNADAPFDQRRARIGSVAYKCGDYELLSTFKPRVRNGGKSSYAPGGTGRGSAAS